MAIQLSPRASDTFEGNAKLKQVKVLVCTETCTLNGYIYCMKHQRLLDALNQSSITNSLPIGKDFIALTDVELLSPGRARELMASICVRKSSILFVGEKSEHEPKIPEFEDKTKMYLARTKNPVEVEIHMPLYTLTGRMHAEVWQQVLDVVDRADKFLPLTAVDIHPALDNEALTFDFMAVNRDKIIYVCESLNSTEALLRQRNPL